MRSSHAYDTCCICGGKIYGLANDASPVVEGGLCCDICNKNVVIPHRLAEASGLSVSLARYIIEKDKDGYETD